jgi:hypothetical protein
MIGGKPRQVMVRNFGYLCDRKSRVVPSRKFSDGVFFIVQIRRNHRRRVDNLVLHFRRLRNAQHLVLEIVASLRFHSFVLGRIYHNEPGVAEFSVLSSGGKKC